MYKQNFDDVRFSPAVNFWDFDRKSGLMHPAGIEQKNFWFLGLRHRAVDPHSLFADPDLAVFLNADPDPGPGLA